MDNRRWQAWAAVFALAVGVTAAGPVRAQKSQGKAPAVASTDVTEATRLAAEVERLHREGKYDAARPLAERALA